MYDAAGLVPARFLILIAHICISGTLLWSNQEMAMACLPSSSHSTTVVSGQQFQLMVGLSLTLGLIGFELITFLTGITMFHSTSALTSICGHGSASILLVYFLLDNWQCGWFWWLFGISSVLPALVDSDLNHSEEKKEARKDGWTFLLILAGVSTCLGAAMSCGWGIGVINSPAEIIQDFCNNSIYHTYGVELSKPGLNLLWSIVVSIFIVGGVTGSLTGAWVANKVGRKGSLIGANILLILAAVLFLACKSFGSVELLILGRLIIGLAGGLTTSVMPMYLTELAPIALRGIMGVLCPLGLTFGVFFSQIFGLKFILGGVDSWHYLLSFYVVFVVMSLFAYPFLPESPKYLYVICNQPNVAIREMSRLLNKEANELVEEIEALQISQRIEEAGGTWSIKRVLKDPSLRLPLMLVCALQAGQQCSGINAVFYYSLSIFKSAGLSDEGSQYANIGAGAVNFLVAVLVMPLMFHTGRRVLAQFSCITAAFFLCVLALSITYINATSWMPYICIVAVLAYVFFYGLGLGPIPYFIGSELFEVGPRPAAMALGSMSNWAGNFMVGMTFPTLQLFIGPFSFFIFATIVLFLFIFLRIYLPETNGRDIGEIAQLCSQGLKSRPLDPTSQQKENLNPVKV